MGLLNALLHFPLSQECALGTLTLTLNSLASLWLPTGIRADLQQIIPPSLLSKGIFASSPPKPSLANLLSTSIFAALPNIPAQVFAHFCQGKIFHESRQDRQPSLALVCLLKQQRNRDWNDSESTPLCSVLGRLSLEFGKFLIALAIDNLSRGICSALRGTSAKNTRLCTPESLETWRESKFWEVVRSWGDVVFPGAQVAVKAAGDRTSKACGDLEEKRERNTGLLEAACAEGAS